MPVRVLDTTPDDDLALFSRYLWQCQLVHRVFEEQGRQILEVPDEGAAEFVRERYSAWRAGSLVIDALPEADRARRAGLLQRLSVYPALSALLVLSVACFPITWGDNTVLRAFALVDVQAVTSDGQVWRLFTPILLHFGFVHLAFNVAIVAEFGRRVERGLGSAGLLGAVAAIAAVSNLSQLLLATPALFGGLSGVAYGLLGLTLVRRQLAPDDPAWQVHGSLAVMLIAFLVLMSTGVTEFFDLYIANTAHWAGLVSGLVIGAITGLRRA